MQEFLIKALQLRPQPPTFNNACSIDLQLVQGILRDGIPTPLTANQEERWKDQHYAIACASAADKDKDAYENCCVLLFGSTAEGCSVLLVVEGYRPWVRLELNNGALCEGEAVKLKHDLEHNSGIRGTVELEMETLKRFYGWQPDAADKDGLKTKRYKYAKFSFSNLKSAQNAVYFLERKGWSITDKLVKPLARFMNDKNLTPADWMHVSNAECLETKLQRISNCQLEFKCNIRDISSRPRDEIAPLLIMSFDGEMYSHDGAFPCVQKGDGTIYIGANFWTYGTPLSQTKKFMVCLGNVEKPLGAEDDIEYCCFSTKKEMLEAFRDLLVAADPDIVTSWNGFGFDFPFLDADYAAEFLKPHERGNESLQLLASALAKSIVFPSEHEEQQYSAAHYLAHIRSNKGPVETSRVIASAQRLCGYKAVAQLLKQEKDLKKATGNSHSLISSLHAHHEDSDDDETYESGGLEAHVASKLCGLLRNHCNGIAQTDTRHFVELLNSASAEQCKEFWARMSVHGKAVVDMLKKPMPSSSPKRGMFLGRLASEKSTLIEKRMSSAARGDNTYNFWDMVGRINIDLMQIIKDDKKPDDNTLRSASDQWLGAELAKMDLTAAEMFAAYRSEDKNRRWDIVKYCARDCDIPLHLIHRLSYVPIWIEMSRVCFTWPQDVVNSGQQIKVFNLLSRFVYGEFALNVRVSDIGWPQQKYEDDDKKRKADYQGATVIEPEVGFYEDCVVTLDFESLYPSIIRYFNLCPSVIVLDDISVTTPRSKNSARQAPVEEHEIIHNIKDETTGKYKEETRKYSFVTHVQGVLPRLLKRLLEARKSVKKLMVQCKDPLQKAVLNGRQNGIKVACNSVYGFCGVSDDRGLLPCKPVAAVTTLKGRAFIDAAKTFVESTWNQCKVIYGDTDSLMIKLPKGTTVPQAAEFGMEAAEKITKLIRSGAVSSIGGAGSLLKAKSLVEESFEQASPERDLGEACSAVSLAYEKTFLPYLLIGKKMYAGVKYVDDAKGGFKSEISYAGIGPVRRDRSYLLRETCKKVLHALLLERSLPAALKTLDMCLQNIAGGKVDLDEFVLSKSLKGNYASGNLPHVTAWKRMNQRGDEGLPAVGSRMPFVVIMDKSGGGGKKSMVKLYERTEHPAFVKKHKMKVDLLYYIESLQNPVIGLLKFVVPLHQLKEMFDKAIEKAEIFASGTKSLLQFSQLEEKDYCGIDQAKKRRKIQPTVSNSLKNFFS